MKWSFQRKLPNENTEVTTDWKKDNSDEDDAGGWKNDITATMTSSLVASSLSAFKTFFAEKSNVTLYTKDIKKVIFIFKRKK